MVDVPGRASTIATRATTARQADHETGPSKRWSCPAGRITYKSMNMYGGYPSTSTPLTRQHGLEVMLTAPLVLRRWPGYAAKCPHICACTHGATPPRSGESRDQGSLP